MRTTPRWGMMAFGLGHDDHQTGAYKRYPRGDPINIRNEGGGGGTVSGLFNKTNEGWPFGRLVASLSRRVSLVLMPQWRPLALWASLCVPL